MSTPDASADPDMPLVRARLLLAEDDFELRELLAFVLREDGHDVIEARDGNELLELLAADAPTRYSLVVSDVRMPGLTAFDVLGRLALRLPQTPVILITAFGDPEYAPASHAPRREAASSTSRSTSTSCVPPFETRWGLTHARAS